MLIICLCLWNSSYICYIHGGKLELKNDWSFSINSCNRCQSQDAASKVNIIKCSLSKPTTNLLSCDSSISCNFSYMLAKAIFMMLIAISPSSWNPTQSYPQVYIIHFSKIQDQPIFVGYLFQHILSFLIGSCLLEMQVLLKNLISFPMQ